MTLPVAVQLYSVREDLAKDFEGTVRKIADMGYAGVEPYGVPATTTVERARFFHSLGLKVPATHSRLPLGDDKTAVLEVMAALGAEYLVCPSLDKTKYYQSEDGIKQAQELLNEANAVCRANNLTFCYHNHDFEYVMINGRYAADLLREGLDPSIVFELDTYWARTAGADPVQIIRALGPRIPLLHIKDGPYVRGEPMVALGEGKMDIVSIVRAAQGNVKWLIVEIDDCATDMLEALDKSYSYLIGEHLGHGSKS